VFDKQTVLIKNDLPAITQMMDERSATASQTLVVDSPAVDMKLILPNIKHSEIIVISSAIVFYQS
jgi:hypothetical protein